jgi:hypothetical protein
LRSSAPACGHPDRQTKGHLGQSIYLREMSREEGAAPKVDLAVERMAILSAS